jgi:hypothetical protein
MKYTEEHEWLRLEDDIVVVGITEHATSQLGDIVFVELPDVGTTVVKDEEIVVKMLSVSVGSLKSSHPTRPRWTVIWTKQPTTPSSADYRSTR